MSARLRYYLTLACFSLLLLACEKSPVENPQAERPEIVSFSVELNQGNLLSVKAVGTVNAGSTAQVEYWTGQEPAQFTPSLQIGTEQFFIPVIGLKPETAYSFRLHSTNSADGTSMSAIVTVTTGDIPEDMPEISILHSDNPSPGYVMFGFIGPMLTSSYAVIIDNSGTVVWYKKFDRPVSEFYMRGNGHFLASVNESTTSAPFYEFDPLGNVHTVYEPGDNRQMRPHEFRSINGAYAFLSSDYLTMDLTAYGGVSNALVTDIAVEYFRPGKTPFLWRTNTHLNVTDASDDITLTGTSVNPWHGNAIEIEADGHLLVSYRNTSEIIKINSETGAIQWRLGGKNNQFTFLNDPLGGFSHQHGVRRLANGNIIIFDNGNSHSPPESRAVEYALDEQQHTATFVWEYRASPILFSAALGFAQRLSNGNTLITYGTVSRLLEVDPSGRKRWELSVQTAGKFIYRARRIASIYSL